MKTLYIESWALYKAHTEDFMDDLSYYHEFCKGYKSLDIFAGYGRLTNPLSKMNIDIEALEIEPNFMKCIDLDGAKKHLCNILDFNPSKTYERVIAGFNSFCLLQKDHDIQLFFKKLSDILSYGGRASLSYYPISHWDDPSEYEFDYENRTVKYSSSYTVKGNQAVWSDLYQIEGEQHRFDYPVRIYRSEQDLHKFYKNLDLKLIDIIKDYNMKNISIPGWVDYVFEKQ